MASLRSQVAYYRDELRDGIAWVAFWRQGRSWKSDSFYGETDAGPDLANPTFEEEDLETMREIVAEDPNAVLINGYYNCPFFNDDEPGCTVAFMADHIRYRYDGNHEQLIAHLA